MNIDLTQIVVAVIGVLGVIITTVVVPWIKANTTERTQTIIDNIVKTAVYAAQQMYSPEQWQEKKTYAIEAVDKALRARGIVLDTDEISNAIEAMLKSVKTELGDEWENEEQSDSTIGYVS